MLDALEVEVLLLGKRELEHDQLTGLETRQTMGEFGAEDDLGLGLVRAVNVDLGLQDGDKPGAKDPLPDVELLLDDGRDTGRGGLFDHGAHLRAEYVLGTGPLQQFIKVQHGLHQLYAARFPGEAPVHLEEGHHPLRIPKIVSGRPPFDFPVHRLLEENRTDQSLAREGAARHDAGSHLMDEIEHLFVARPGALIDSVEAESLGRAPAALVQRRDESLAGPDLLGLLVKVAHGWPRSWSDPHATYLILSENGAPVEGGVGLVDTPSRCGGPEAGTSSAAHGCAWKGRGDGRRRERPHRSPLQITLGGAER